MADIKWIKLTTNMFEDEKIRLIDAMPGSDTTHYIWIRLLVQAGKTNCNGFIFLSENIPYTDEMLSTIFCRPLNSVRLALKVLKDFGMIEVDEDNFIKISNWDKHQNVEGMDRVREQNKVRAKNHRERKKQLKEESQENKSEDCKEEFNENTNNVPNNNTNSKSEHRNSENNDISVEEDTSIQNSCISNNEEDNFTEISNSNNNDEYNYAQNSEENNSTVINNSHSVTQNDSNVMQNKNNVTVTEQNKRESKKEIKNKNKIKNKRESKSENNNTGDINKKDLSSEDGDCHTLSDFEESQELNNSQSFNSSYTFGGTCGDALADNPKEDISVEAAKLLKHYENITGILGGLDLGAIKLAICMHGSENVLMAINRALEVKKHDMTYINGILKNWRREGYPKEKGRCNYGDGSIRKNNSSDKNEFAGFKPKKPRNITEAERKGAEENLI